MERPPPDASAGVSIPVLVTGALSLYFGLSLTSDPLLLVVIVFFPCFIATNASSIAKGIALASEESGNDDPQGSYSRSKPASPPVVADLGPVRKLLEQGEAGRAVVALTDILAASPKNAEALVLRAQAHLAQNSYDQAALDASAALGVVPDHTQAWRARLQALEALGRLGEARSEADSAVELFEVTDPEVLALRARVAEGGFDARARRAAELKERGNDLFRQSQFDQAVQAYSRALTELGDPAPDAPMELWVALWNNRAACSQQLGNWTAVRSDTNSVLEREPRNLKALSRRAVALESLEQYSAALDDARQVLLQDPQHKACNAVAHRSRQALRG